MTADFFPVGARRHAAAAYRSGDFEVPGLGGALSLAAGDVIMDDRVRDDDVAAAIVAGTPVLRRDPDYVEVPVRGAEIPARIYSDNVAAASPLEADHG